MVQLEIIVGIIGAVGAVLAASIPYYLTKSSEIALEKQKTKLERYDDLLQKFALWWNPPKDEEQQGITQQLVMAYVRASSYASPKVLTAIQEFVDITRTPIPKDEGGITAAHARQLTEKALKTRAKLNEIFMAIREDVTPTVAHFEINAPARPGDIPGSY